MNWKESVYLRYAAWRGYRFPGLLAQYRQEFATGNGPATAAAGLRQLLAHCRQSVPYYAERMARAGDGWAEDPVAYLQKLPVLTKQTIRSHFEQLQSADLSRRRWYYNTSGGSTGQPVRLVQDSEYEDRGAALSLLYYEQLGYHTGQPLVRLWGSERDLEGKTRLGKATFFNWLTGTSWLNAFRMSPERMRACLATLNRTRPRLIVAYAQAAYELARFAEREGLRVVPQHGMVTSAGTLYPFMREKIAQVFGCPVYNSYGSREVSFIGGELPGRTGLWVAPWSNFVEILDEAGQPVPAGTEGNIVVSCLTNFAMPLLRYWIGDRGALLPATAAAGPFSFQVLKHVSGRSVDAFRTRDQTIVDGEYFTHLLYFRPWVEKFQVVQKDPARIVFRVVPANGQPPQGELEEIATRARLAMGPDCRVDFEFPEDLPPLASGKFRYTICEVANS